MQSVTLHFGPDHYKVYDFKNIALVEIKGDTARLESLINISNTNSIYTKQMTENGTYANRMMTLLYYKINNDSNRKRSNAEGNFGFGHDFGQTALWKLLPIWRNNVGLALKSDNNTTTKSLWDSYINTIQDVWTTSASSTGILADADNKGEELLKTVTDEAKGAVNNEYGIEETYYNSKDKEIENKINEDSYTILGPFKYKFSGTIKNKKPTLTFNKDTVSQTYEIGKYIGSKFEITNKIVSEEKFYIKVKTTSLNRVSEIHFNFQIEGISLYNTTTKLYFFQNTTVTTASQPVVYIEQTPGYNTPFKDSYKISSPVEAKLQKLDSSGNALKEAGIEFELRDETGALVAYLETNTEGMAVVTDYRGEPTGETSVVLEKNQTYTLIESYNQKYGYRHCELKASDIEITGADILQDGKNIKFKLKDECNDTVTIKAKNSKKLADLQIEKIDEEGKGLENAVFLIERDYHLGGKAYLQLINEEGQIITTVKGSAVINIDNKASESEYKVNYVEKQSNATRFITDTDGKVIIKNLEVNKLKITKYSYKVYEESNPNYGYGSIENASLTVEKKELIANAVNSIKMTNKQALGSLQIKKYDQDNNNIMLPNVGFAIEISSNVNNEYAYIALYDENGEFVQELTETATINKNNKANKNEYRVEYYYTNKTYKDLTKEQKAKITKFITGDKGIVRINNLEIYSQKTGEEYTYKVIETSNANYGYVVNHQAIDNIKLEKNKTINKSLGNLQIYTKISGYVWLEVLEDKENERNNVYTDVDKKLKDLYITDQNGNVIETNKNAEIPVEVVLVNIENGETVKPKPDQFDAKTGKYTFKDLEITELEKYKILFRYDGFYYTTVEPKLDKDNGSKVKENAQERKDLNNKFASVGENSQVISTDGTINTVEYYKEGHTSVVSKFDDDFETGVYADTMEADEHNFETDFMKLKEQGLNGQIDNINMGIVLREQPKLAIGSDIYNVYVEVNGKGYTYNYGSRQSHYDNLNGDEVGVKFELEDTENKYTRTVYSSDVEALKKGTATMKVSIIYKIQLFNESSTLTSKIYQIKNYYDSSYEIAAIGESYDEVKSTKGEEPSNTGKFEIVEKETNVEVKREEGVEENVNPYHSAKIKLNGENGIELKTGEREDIYIRFNISTETIKGLLDGTSTYHNATEIMSYSTHYGEVTNQKIGSSDETKAGNLYAGIDKSSQPGNIELILTNDLREPGTVILETENFEYDTTSAPSFILEAEQSRKISGTVWEDAITNTNNNERLGNGVFNQGEEKAVKGVKVELYKINDDGSVGEIAKYSNGAEVSTTSDENGNYTFGYYDEETQEHIGILPGEYVIKYTYGTFENESLGEIKSYINNTEKYVNPNEYKSTIIKSNIIEKAFKENNDKRWYLEDEGTRYSDARDDLSLRNEYKSENSDFTLTNSTYNNIIALESMNACTPIMDIGIEFTKEDEANGLTFDRVSETGKIDFGIVERPKARITIEKEITGLEIIAQNGMSIIPYGNPSEINSKMQYVRSLDGLVSAEIETDLLQGAKLSVEYTITVKNESDRDYLGEEYYHYGTGQEELEEITPKANQVVDYMDATMTIIDSEENSKVWKARTAQELSDEGLINQDAYNKLSTGEYNILTTEAFNDTKTGHTNSVKLYTSRYLAVSDSISVENIVEIIEIQGIRIIDGNVPGDYIPGEDPTSEGTTSGGTTSGGTTPGGTTPEGTTTVEKLDPPYVDHDKVELVITPPTGTTVNYIIYIISAVVTFAILVSGIVIIKKKLIK